MHCSVLWWHKFVSTLFRKFVDFIRLRVREWVWVSTCMCVQITSISVPNIVVAYPNVIPTVDTDQHMITYKNNTQQKRKNSKEHFSILIRFAYSSVTLWLCQQMQCCIQASVSVYMYVKQYNQDIWFKLETRAHTPINDTNAISRSGDHRDGCAHTTHTHTCWNCRKIANRIDMSLWATHQ